MGGNIKSQFFATELSTWSIPLMSYHTIPPPGKIYSSSFVSHVDKLCNEKQHGGFVLKEA